MAIKDWKKTNFGWRNNKTVIEIEKLDKYLVDIYKWTRYSSEIETILKKKFKTKQAALKFAKSYMRKN